MYKLNTIIHQNSVSGETVMVVAYPGNGGFSEYDADVPEHWRKAYWMPGKFIVLDCDMDE
jgi:hypothetical protein